MGLSCGKSGRILTSKTCSKQCDQSNVKQCKYISEGDKRGFQKVLEYELNRDQKKNHVNSLICLLK